VTESRSALFSHLRTFAPRYDDLDGRNWKRAGLQCVFANELPQIFLKETAVILKSAIYRRSVQNAVGSSSEVVRGIGGDEYPSLLGYVATTPKPRAENGPFGRIKAIRCWRIGKYGLGRAVAFTSDAKSRWAKIWLNWEKVPGQFWSQIAQWVLRRLENADFTTNYGLIKATGLSMWKRWMNRNYRNFLSLQTVW